MKLLREGGGNMYGTCCTFSLSKKIGFKNALKQNVSPNKFCKMFMVPCQTLMPHVDF